MRLMSSTSSESFTSSPSPPGSGFDTFGSSLQASGGSGTSLDGRRVAEAIGQGDESSGRVVAEIESGQPRERVDRLLVLCR
jgi:hypothetical protein